MLHYKNKILIMVLSIIIFASVLITLVNSNFIKRVSYKWTKNKDTNKIILIDPGHGGMDGGAVSPYGTVEKDINLKISLKLKEKLQKEGFKVIMTREEDKGLYSDKGRVRDKKVEDLNNRCKLKEESKCDLFVSIHLNMFEVSKYYGAQVWYSNNPDSKKVAKIVQEGLREDLDNNNKREEKPAHSQYKILRVNDYIPGILVECGFLSNPAEEEKLKSDEYQEKIADSICKSIKKYFSE